MNPVKLVVYSIILNYSERSLLLLAVEDEARATYL